MVFSWDEGGFSCPTFPPETRIPFLAGWQRLSGNVHIRSRRQACKQWASRIASFSIPGRHMAKGLWQKALCLSLEPSSAFHPGLPRLSGPPEIYAYIVPLGQKAQSYNRRSQYTECTAQSCGLPCSFSGSSSGSEESKSFATLSKKTTAVWEFFYDFWNKIRPHLDYCFL